MPVGLALALTGAFAAILNKRRTADWRLLALAAACAALGLLSTDPQFPAKRIHVPQFALLAAMLRLTLPDYAGWTRTLGAAILASLYGVHDEFVQGLMASRSYGTADMVANALGALAGALALHDPRARRVAAGLAASRASKRRLPGLYRAASCAGPPVPLASPSSQSSPGRRCGCAGSCGRPIQARAGTC